MSRMSRMKGKRGELEACEALADVWPGLQRTYHQSRSGDDAPDIDGPGCPVWIEVKRQATPAHSFGLKMELLTPKEAQDLWPLMTVDDVIGAAFLPTDGQANPSDITQALAKGARQSGVTILEDTKVLSVIVENGRIRGLETSAGRIECEIVVCCTGQWTRRFAATLGVNVPLVSVQHQYMVTEPIAGVTLGELAPPLGGYRLGLTPPRAARLHEALRLAVISLLNLFPQKAAHYLADLIRRLSGKSARWSFD